MISSAKTFPVFLSVGKLYTRDQETLLERVMNGLQAAGLTSQMVPRDQSYRENPLREIRTVISQCRGAVVIAFTRTCFEAGTEWPGTSMAHSFDGRNLTTVWNQIEAAMAFQRGIPVLTLADDRLHQEGLLSPKHPEYGVVLYNLARCQQELPPAVQTAIRDFALRVQHFEPWR
jgi:hypothetical protein